eukprot:11628711-Karenia_brevis.AAC.1
MQRVKPKTPARNGPINSVNAGFAFQDMIKMSRPINLEPKSLGDGLLEVFEPGWNLNNFILPFGVMQTIQKEFAITGQPKVKIAQKDHRKMKRVSSGP